MHMTRKEKFAHFIGGILVMAPIYAGILYFISGTGIDWIQTILFAVLWSAGMVVFENWWQKRKVSSEES